jgi:hypothetical protein
MSESDRSEPKLENRIEKLVQVGQQFDDDGAAFDEVHRRLDEHHTSLAFGIGSSRSAKDHAAIELSHRYIDDWEEGDDPDPTTIEFVETVAETAPDSDDIDYESYHNEYQRQMSDLGVDVVDRHPMIVSE